MANFFPNGSTVAIVYGMYTYVKSLSIKFTFNYTSVVLIKYFVE